MSQRDLLGLMWANLKRMRARVTLTALGVVIGTAAVVLLISLAIGLQTSAEAQLGGFGDLTTIEVFSGGMMVMAAGPGMASSSSGADDGGVKLDRAALDAMKALPHVVAVSPKTSLSAQLSIHYNRQTFSPGTTGLEPNAAEKLGWRLAAGRANIGRGQIVIGQKVLANEFGPMAIGRPGANPYGPTPAPTPRPEDLVGKSLGAELIKYDGEGKEITRRERLRVAGVFESSGGQDDYSLYMGLDDVEAFNKWATTERRRAGDGYQNVLVKVDDRVEVKGVQSAIEDMGFSTFSAAQILESINRTFIIMQVVLGGIGAIALLVAAFGIANTMTMAIYERTREIGVMKAIGATNRDVLKVFLAEAGAIGAIGGVVGVSLALLLAQIIELFLKQVMASRQTAPDAGGGDPLNLLVTPLWLVAFAIVFAVFVGLVSGVYPALRAANLRPVQALRSD